MRGEVLAALLLGAVPPRPGYASGIWLRGARVTGRLRLKGAVAEAGLHCTDCEFDDKVEFVDANLRTLRIERCRLPRLVCSRLHLDGLLNLEGSEIEQGLWLDGARVGGPLLMNEMRLGPVLADKLTVEGRLDARNLKVQGEFRAHNAHIGGSLHLGGAQMSNPGGIAMSLGGITVEGGVWCWRGFEAEGTLRLVGATFTANLTLDGARLSQPGEGTALNLDRASIGHLIAHDLQVEAGQVSMRGTQVSGGVDMRGAVLAGDGPDEPVLAIDNATMAYLELRNIRASGEVMIRACRVENRIWLSGAEVRNPEGNAVRLNRTEVGADVFCRDLTLEGTLRLSRSRIGGVLELEDVRLSGAASTLIYGHALQAGEFKLIPAQPVRGTVFLNHAQIGVLHDDPVSWPTELVLTGTRYDALEPRLPAGERLRWLTRSPEGYESQPYEQLANYYAATGQNADARKVLYAKERHRQATETRMIRVWSRLQDITTGYGYRPWRALLWLGVLLTVGGLVYGFSPPAPLKRDEAPHFNPVIYTLDLLIPIVDLGQERAFNPAGAHQWLSYTLVAAGWVLTATVAAGAARIVSRR
ncbi:hypothetical protein [Actinomadura rudentiformis]|uniref:Oxidoreductase n=1 Tax=Actinomadura rudentiformis TaxID=359158 RepID=A0A6H9Z1M4_9ACTN|nr:hypothetical protein [Actinomadura rudentiformis]KAB2347025.1 hypothetical protein F8566_22910 [Actinomadura rudentiformis]